ERLRDRLRSLLTHALCQRRWSTQYLRENLIRRKLRSPLCLGQAKQARQRRESRSCPRLLARHQLTSDCISRGLFLHSNLGCASLEFPRCPLNRAPLCESLPCTPEAVSADCSALNARQRFRAQETPNIFRE